MVEKAWCVVLLEGYSQHEVGFTVCSVQMNVCLKGHPIWRSFGTEQLAYRSGKVRNGKRRMFFCLAFCLGIRPYLCISPLFLEYNMGECIDHFEREK